MKYDNPRCLTSELFTCKTLQLLNLDSSIIIKPKLVHLPNLKILRLFGVELTDDGSIPQILAGCPKLEHLHMCGCQLHGIQVLDISTPSLKGLEFFNCYGAFGLVIDTPNLEDLCYVDFLNRDPLVKNLKSLVKAYLFPYSVTLQNTDDACLCGDHVSKFLNAMDNTKSLTLLTVCLEGLLHSSCSIPKFQNLTHMKLVPRHNCHWELLPILLHSTPNLKTLALDMEFPDNDIRQWPKFPVTQNRPICLAQYLRTVDIFNFKGMQFELDLLSYLLQYGQVLEKINLNFSQNNGFSNWSDAVRKISALPKKSRTCQLEFLCTSKNTFCKPVCLTSMRS
ncbi:putative F-box/FBD/LRR-repeat protein At1g66290 [Coffea eugenioides]|uniref:putative F-box/FBD/LRR-repeat protein At1g66290 n=1 Tax=Coffea eugenioides TaxID=49369 RepID=UPI000F60E4DC|nr:putative F-box/FBD/LRR-repeat protein At1g66290 [Coffea eugenioides]